VADSFEGLPPPDPKYEADKNDTHHTHNYLRVGLDEVKNNFQRYDLLDQDVIFIKGFFEHSLKNTDIEKLSILRLDGDMYSSTIQVLDYLYDKLSVGGYCIIDDYGWIPNCRKAVDDFLEKRNISTKLIPIDSSGVYFQKQ
jgi:O-methyltransferase